MKICVNGSRDFTGFLRLCDELDSLIPQEQRSSVTLLSGGARGADILAEKWAKDRQVHVKRFEAEWKGKGRAAGPIRNQEMINEADRLISFWDGKSRGTKDTIDRASAKGIPVTIIAIEEKKR